MAPMDEQRGQTNGSLLVIKTSFVYVYKMFECEQRNAAMETSTPVGYEL